MFFPHLFFSSWSFRTSESWVRKSKSGRGACPRCCLDGTSGGKPLFLTCSFLMFFPHLFFSSWSFRTSESRVRKSKSGRGACPRCCLDGTGGGKPLFLTCSFLIFFLMFLPHILSSYSFLLFFPLVLSSVVLTLLTLCPVELSCVSN